MLLVKQKDRCIILGENGDTLGCTAHSELEMGCPGLYKDTDFEYILSIKNCQDIEREYEIREYFKWHKEKEYISHKEEDIKEYVENSFRKLAWEVGMAVETQCSCACHRNSNITHFMACCNPGRPIKDPMGCIILHLI